MHYKPEILKKINLCETLTDYGYGVKDSMRFPERLTKNTWISSVS